MVKCEALIGGINGTPHAASCPDSKAFELAKTYLIEIIMDENLIINEKGKPVINAANGKRINLAAEIKKALAKAGIDPKDFEYFLKIILDVLKPDNFPKEYDRDKVIELLKEKKINLAQIAKLITFIKGLDFARGSELGAASSIVETLLSLQSANLVEYKKDYLPKTKALGEAFESGDASKLKAAIKGLLDLVDGDRGQLPERAQKALKIAEDKVKELENGAAKANAESDAASQADRHLSITGHGLLLESVYGPLTEPQLTALSTKLPPGVRIISFQEGPIKLVAVIKWNDSEKKWEIAKWNDQTRRWEARSDYRVENREGKIFVKRDKEVEAKLVVDSAWKRIKAMGVSYTDYQRIFADERITWEEFERLGGTREAYNFWSWGGIVNKDGDEGISASDMEMVFKNHINKVTKGLGKDQEAQIIKGYVVAKHFVIIPAEQAAKRLLEGKGDSISAADLLKEVGPGSQIAAKKVIENLDPNFGRYEPGQIILDKAKVELFIATMGFLAQVEVEGYRVDTSKLKNKSALKDADNVLAWLKGDEVSESEGGSSSSHGGEVDEKLRELDKEASDVKKGNPLKHFKGDLVNNERALDIMYKYYLKKGDYANAAKYALRLPVEQAKEALGKIAEHYSSKIDGEIKAGDRDSDQTEKKKYYDRAKKLIEDFKPIIEIVKEKGKDPAALVSNINGAINSVKVPLARGYAELENPEARKTAREIVGDINDDEEVKLGGNNNSKSTPMSGKEIKAEIEKMIDLDPRNKKADKLLFKADNDGRPVWNDRQSDDSRKTALALLDQVIRKAKEKESSIDDKYNAAHAKTIKAQALVEMGRKKWESKATDIVKDNKPANDYFEEAAKLLREAAETYDKLIKDEKRDTRKEEYKTQRDQAYFQIAIVAMFYNEEATSRKTAKNNSGYNTLLKKATEIAKKIPNGIKLTMFKQPIMSDVFKKQIGNAGAKQKFDKQGTDATGGRGGKASGDKNKLR